MAHGPIKDYDAELKSHGFLNPNDPVAISFWISSISMVASTVFFLMESGSLAKEFASGSIAIRCDQRRRAVREASKEKGWMRDEHG